MSEVDFQNGLVAGLTIAGKNGAMGGVRQPPPAITPQLVALQEVLYKKDWLPLTPSLGLLAFDEAFHQKSFLALTPTVEFIAFTVA